MSFCSKILFSIIFSITQYNLNADNFKTNSFNNHGYIGLINTPTARFYDEESFGFTLYDGTPDQKFTLSVSPYDWLEASAFYTNIQDLPYCNTEDSFCNQDAKDKGFNIKIRLKKEDRLPAIAIGLNDIGGTGFYSSEYIVASYGIENVDFSFGLGWGSLNGTKDFKNPFRYLSDNFSNRPSSSLLGGDFNKDQLFSNKDVSPFFGISYLINKNLLLKFERDTTDSSGRMPYEERKSELSLGLDFLVNDNFTFGLSAERGNFFSVRFSYKKDKKAQKSTASNYQKVAKRDNQDKYQHFISSVRKNGIGVNELYKNTNKNILGLEITQFKYPNLDFIEEIIMTAKEESGIDEEISTNYTIADLQPIRNFDNSFKEDSEIIYIRNKKPGFNTNTRINLRPFLASREGFLKGAVLLENDSEYRFSDNLIFSSNLKYTLWDNFDDLNLPPVDVGPAQVRSDVKDYLKNFDNNLVIGRAQLDFFKTLNEKNHLMFTSGILEEMFSGYGIEYLHFDRSKNYAYGVEIFNVYKRDYDLAFGTLDYENVTGHFNFYYRNYGSVPFDAKISFGQYLAGDQGGTIELSRSFKSGLKFGVFATFTDISKEEFGEGSFDKGIFFNMPIFGDMINYSWRPLTKDPGQKLIRKNNLHDLLVKFRPIN